MAKANIEVQQSSFSGMCEVENAIKLLSNSDPESRGAIYTRVEVVEFILDLVGYTADQPLYTMRLLEPSFGEGDFLTVVVERLLDSVQSSKLSKNQLVEALQGCVCGVELHQDSFSHTADKLRRIFKKRDFDSKVADVLLESWLMQGDFLLSSLGKPFSHIVGNPPYLRQEMIPNVLMTEYRTRFQTIYDRADLYVPFIEKSLINLAGGGSLGFICADRWMKNKYGQKLRAMIANGYRLNTYVDMVNTQAFHADVSAYPAIFVISRTASGPTRIALRPSIDSDYLQVLANEINNSTNDNDTANVRVLSAVAFGTDPWLLDQPDELRLVRRLEQDFPAIEDAGCKVGIGVATGADRAFIGPFDELDVEPDRKLPIVMTRDIRGGTVKSRGFGIVNPFKDEGGLVSLDDYPKLQSYFEKRRDQIIKRHVSKNNPINWYRTIDRIYPALAKKPKLLIPDIKGDAHIVYEEGVYYPHHNLYYVVSEEWNLRALQAVLSSGIARIFVALYSTQMRGGYLRFQAQYLRRIRIPKWQAVDKKVQSALVAAGESGDLVACNQAVRDLYSLSKSEAAILNSNREQT